jgi:MFS family permease
VLSIVFVRDTGGHVALEQQQSAQPDDERAPALREAFVDASWRQADLRACSQAGLVNNLNDALAWGLVPLFLVANGASAAEVGLVAGIYPGVWGVGQIFAGRWSDRVGRKPLIVAGMLLQSAALAVLAVSDGAIGLAALAATVLGVGTALVYPTLIAAISDAVSPVARAPSVGVYRFWRDMGYVAGGLVAGLAADAFGYGGAIAIVAALTAASGAWVAIDLRTGEPDTTVDALLEAARAGLVRVTPAEALERQRNGAVLIDIRSESQMARDGLLPGATVIQRNVLEWRLDPASPDRNPDLARRDRELVVICNQGYQSSLAAATLRRFGLDATDVIGGAQAWFAAGLPVERDRAR